MASMAWLFVAVAGLLAALAKGQMPDWQTSPAAFLSLLAQMPVQEQRVYLQIAGAQLQSQTGGQCNVFGGPAACQSLPESSQFAQKCPNHDLQVDCAYYAEDMAEAQDQDPADRLRDSLKSLGHGNLEKACPQCFQNQMALWCSQMVPQCGSFSAAVEGAILPAITTMVKAQDNGRPPLQALSDAVPQLMAATDLTLPCSQMCEAVVSSCGCQRESKFGPLLEAYVADQASSMTAPPGFTTQIFGSLYDRPICSLYGNSSAPGYAGHCETLPTACTDQAKWCGAQQADSAGAEVQQLMAAQLAFALFGWLDSPTSSLFQDAAGAVASADSKDAKQLEKQYLVQGPTADGKQTSTWAIVAHTLVAVALVALLAGAVYYVVQRRRREQDWAKGYTSIADDDAGQGFLSQGQQGL